MGDVREVDEMKGDGGGREGEVRVTCTSYLLWRWGGIWCSVTECIHVYMERESVCE